MNLLRKSEHIAALLSALLLSLALVSCATSSAASAKKNAGLLTINCSGNLDKNAALPLLSSDMFKLPSGVAFGEKNIYDAQGNRRVVNACIMRTDENIWELSIRVMQAEFGIYCTTRIGICDTEGCIGSGILSFDQDGNLCSIKDSAGNNASFGDNAEFLVSYDVNDGYGNFTQSSFVLSFGGFGKDSSLSQTDGDTAISLE